MLRLLQLVRLSAQSVTESALQSDEERVWLWRFLTFTTNLGFGLVGVSLIIYLLTWSLPALLVVGVMLLGCFMMLWIRRQLNTWRLTTIGFFIFTISNMASIGVVILIPQALPSALFGPLLALVISLPYFSSMSGKGLFFGTWLIGMLIALIGVSLRLFPEAPWAFGIPFLFSVGYIFALLLFVTANYHKRLRTLLAQTQQTNQQLTTMHTDLEQTIIQRTAELSERERRFRTISELTSDYAFEVAISPTGKVTTIWVSEAFQQIVGISAETFDQQGGFRSLVIPVDLVVIERRIRTVLSNQPDQSEFRITHPSGEIRWLKATTKPIWSDVEQRVVGAFGAVRNITERKQYERQIDELIFYDPLTRLGNRQLLLVRLSEALGDAQRLDLHPTVLHLDLDRFKTVNATLGIDGGDSLLTQVAQRLLSVLGSSDQLFRLSGDEFAILRYGEHATPNPMPQGHPLMAAFDTPFFVCEQPIRVSASVGIVSYPQHGTDATNLLKHAEIAMYTAKQRGSQIEIFDPTARSFSHERFEIEHELRQAIDRCELTFFYQPIYELTTGSVQHVEALVRWIHPQRGLLSPAVFIPIAEEAGLIRLIDRFALQKGIQQVADWATAGYNLSVAINLSVVSLQDLGLVHVIRELLVNSGAPPENIVLEVTESAAMRDIDTTLRVLGQIKALGVRIALDDFGAGHASLTYLKQLPIDMMKVDRSFIAGIQQSNKDESVLRAVLTLAQGLRLPVIAEGVERPEQLQWLQSVGFEHIQGYLIGRPQPPTDFVAHFAGLLSTAEPKIPRLPSIASRITEWQI
jgi:diguanylate cyclase (GGDEF)-like protein/PAS domain S-box-containing protein